MDLHAVEKDGTTFGMEVSTTAPAYKRMMRNAEPRMVKHHFATMKMMCVKADDLAVVMGHAGWLVRERKLIETVQFGEGQTYYVVYGEEEK